MAPRFRFLRRADGSIWSVRPAGDPVFNLLWLSDPEVRAYFEERDRAKRIAAGSTEADELEREEAEARTRRLLRERFSAWRGFR